ncbi:hypothetical protein GCM10023158_18470 [Gluconacetobacter tumulicola]
MGDEGVEAAALSDMPEFAPRNVDEDRTGRLDDLPNLFRQDEQECRPPVDHRPFTRNPFHGVLPW